MYMTHWLGFSLHQQGNYCCCHSSPLPLSLWSFLHWLCPWSFPVHRAVVIQPNLVACDDSWSFPTYSDRWNPGFPVFLVCWTRFDHGTTIIFKTQNPCFDDCISVPIAISSPQPNGQDISENLYVAFIQNHSVKNTTLFDFSKPKHRIHSHCFHSKFAFQTSKNS